jgi:phage-related protein
MPKTNVIIYQERDGRVPLLEWLDGLSSKARDKCIVRVELLKEKGHELRRPHCDILERGIYELRSRIGSVHYRILYAFIGKNAVLLSHGCTKERKVPKSEIDRAVKNRDNYNKDPKFHTYLREL